MKWLPSNTNDADAGNGNAGLRRSKGSKSRSEVTHAQVNLGVFGKHPGWNDHIEDLGIETQRLVDVKRVLYVEGIGGNIDSGAWDKLEETQRMEGFHHVFLWWTSQDVVIGRLWSSRDGKGRTRYPMVVAAQCIGLPISWAVERVLPLLERVEQQCVATTEAQDVQAITESARQEIRSQAEGLTPSTDSPVEACRSLVQIADQPVMGEQGLERVLYQLEREIPGLVSVSQDTTSKSANPRTQHVRVPAGGDTAGHELGTWSGFLRALLPKSLPFLLLYPLGESWVDLIVGDPSGSNLYVVKTLPSKVPLTTQVPYNLEQTFIDQTQELLDWARQESLKPAAVVPVSISPPRSTGRSTPDQSGEDQPSIWPKVAIAVGVVVVLIVIGWLALSGGGSSPPSAKTSSHPPSQPGSTTSTPMAVFDEAAWAQWCEAYAKWFGRFLNDLNDSSRAAFMRDPHLRLIVEKIDEARSRDVELDPSLVAQAPGADLLDLASRPPKRVMNAQGVMKTRLGVGVINQIKEAVEQWPVLVRARQSAQLFESLGWLEMARYVRSYTEPVSTEADAKLVDAVVRLLEAAPQIVEVESVWRKIQPLRQSVVESGDPVLARFGGWVDESAKAAATTSPLDPVKVREQLSDLQGLSGRLDAVVSDDWDRIDHQALQEDEPIYHQIGDTVTEEVFTRWLRDVKAYYRPAGHEDPRQQRRLTQRFEAVKENLARLKARQDYEPIPELDQQLKRVQSRFDQLASMPWIARDEAKVQRAADEADTALRALGQRVDDAHRQLAMAMQDYVDALKNKQQLALSGSQAIDTHWQRRRDELIEAEQDYSVLQRKIDRLEAHLKVIDQQLQPGLPNELLTTTWSQTIARSVMWDRREEALAKLLDQTDWIQVTGGAGQAPGSSDVPPLSPQQEETVRSYNALQDRAVELVRDFTTIDQFFRVISPTTSPRHRTSHRSNR